MSWLSGFYVHSGVGKGFLYEWPLAKTVLKLLVDSFVERITFHFTDNFSLSVKCVNYNFLQFSITHDKV